MGGCTMYYEVAQPNIETENPKHLGSITIEGKEWQVCKTLTPCKDGQPYIICSLAKPKMHQAQKSISSMPLTRQPAVLINAKQWLS
jgi:hypothetical protein